VLDGVVVAFDTAGRVSSATLRPRTEVTDREAARRLATRVPVQYLAFDVLWLDGESTMDKPYAGRRELLDGLAVAGPHWQAPPHFPAGGGYAVESARGLGAGAVVAKRLDSPYEPGSRSRAWREIPC
jgi:bifunctional non-homologous end joining protein LigD